MKNVNKECKIVFGFNDLGMLMFACETHGNPEITYDRLPHECRHDVIRSVEKLFKTCRIKQKK